MKRMKNLAKAEEIASMLNGRTSNLTKTEMKTLEDNDLVIISIYYEDNLWVFNGALSDEAMMDSFETVYFKDGKHYYSNCSDGEECEYFLELAEKLPKAKWEEKEDDIIMLTNIPHVKFCYIETINGKQHKLDAIIVNIEDLK